MATNVSLDDTLLDEAVKVGGKATKKATVTVKFSRVLPLRLHAPQT